MGLGEKTCTNFTFRMIPCRRPSPFFSRAISLSPRDPLSVSCRATGHLAPERHCNGMTGPVVGAARLRVPAANDATKPTTSMHLAALSLAASLQTPGSGRVRTKHDARSSASNALEGSPRKCGNDPWLRFLGCEFGTKICSLPFINTMKHCKKRNACPSGYTSGHSSPCPNTAKTNLFKLPQARNLNMNQIEYQKQELERAT